MHEWRTNKNFQFRISAIPTSNALKPDRKLANRREDYLKSSTYHCSYDSFLHAVGYLLVLEHFIVFLGNADPQLVFPYQGQPIDLMLGCRAP